MTMIDARNLPCPGPTIKARDAIKGLSGGDMVQVLLDNPLAAENLERMSKAAGHTVILQAQDKGEYTVIITIRTERSDNFAEAVLFTFPTTKLAVAGEKALLAAGLSVKVLPMPEQLAAACGIVLRLPPDELEAGKAALQATNITIEAVYQQTECALIEI